MRLRHPNPPMFSNLTMFSLAAALTLTSASAIAGGTE